jgi:hypothetical protein
MKQQNRKNKEQKTPLIFRIGLILICAMMISCYIMSGIYARYSTTVTGKAIARTAKFSGGTLICDQSFNIDLAEIENLDNCFPSDSQRHVKYFAVNVDFSIKFDEAEVVRNFIFDLIIVPFETIDGGKTSFKCPEDTTYELNIETSEAINTANYVKDNLYYLIPKGIEITVTEDGNLQFTGDVPIGAPEYNLEVTYFIPIAYFSSLSSIEAESDIFAYNFVCEQVD